MRWRWFVRALPRPPFAALAASMLGSLGFGQVAPATMAPVAPAGAPESGAGTPARPWQVIERHEIDCGDHSLIFNRVVPPQLKPTTASGAPGAPGAVPPPPVPE